MLRNLDPRNVLARFLSGCPLMAIEAALVWELFMWHDSTGEHLTALRREAVAGRPISTRKE